jgi:hypothetical protein
MRQTISAIIAAVAVVTAGAAPASACGLSGCGWGYSTPVYTGCGPCGGAAYGYPGYGAAGYERLSTPAYQYGAQPYQVHQYYFVDQGPTFSGPGDFAPRPTYQEGGYSYRVHPHYHNGYRYWGHGAPRSVRYGYHGMPHHYGYRGAPLRRLD